MSVLDRGGGVVEHAVDDVGELGIVAHRRAEQQPERGAVALDEAEVGGEALLRPAPARSRRRSVASVSTASSRPPTSSSTRDEQRPLRREVLVEDRLGDAGGLRDVVHRRGVEAALGELDARDVEELAAALVGRSRIGADAARRRHPPVLDFSGIS